MEKTYARKRIKEEAWGNLSGNWFKSFVIMLLQSIFTMVIFSLLPIRIPEMQEIMNASGDPRAMLRLFFPNVITEKTVASIAVTVIIYLLVMSPFSIGNCRFFLKVARGEKGKLSDVFSAYTSLKTVFSSVWLTLLTIFLSTFWTLLFSIIPATLVLVASYIKSALLLYLATFLVPIASLFALLWNSRYTFASYIFAEGKLGAFASLRECISLMHGRNGECIMLRFSYLLWDVASSYIPPLGFVYNAVFGTVYAKYLFYLRQREQ